MDLLQRRGLPFLLLPRPSATILSKNGTVQEREGFGQADGIAYLETVREAKRC